MFTVDPNLPPVRDPGDPRQACPPPEESLTERERRQLREEARSLARLRAVSEPFCFEGHRP